MHDHREQPWYVCIKRERLSLSLSIEEAAEQLGVDERTLRDWEAGRHFPSYAGRRALRDLYGKSLDELGLLPPLEP
jgi:transcriptional regulator with XRE-family HTH domain